jgi:hypothetical protein
MNLPFVLLQTTENKPLLHEALLILRGRLADGSANARVTAKDSLARRKRPTASPARSRSQKYPSAALAAPSHRRIGVTPASF